MLTQIKIKLKTKLETAIKKATDTETAVNNRSVKLAVLSAAKEV